MLEAAAKPPEPQTGIMQEERNYKFVLDSNSDVLWVILTARNAVPGRFMYYANGLKLPGSKLFLLSLHEDFYQGMFDACLDMIADLQVRHGIKKTHYMGFSAGAYGALVLGLRGRGTGRVLAFGPLFRLDDRTGLGHMHIVAKDDVSPRFDPRYVDIRGDIERTSYDVDIFLGVTSTVDLGAVSDSRTLGKECVRFHYMNCGHDTAKPLSEAGALNAIVHGALTGEAPIVPQTLLASPQDVDIALLTYRMLVRNEKQDVPPIDDSGVTNAAYWDAKAKVRARNGDLSGAIADAMRALKIHPKFDAYSVCLGHYLRDYGFLHLAEASYRRAVEVNSLASAGPISLAYLMARLKRWDEAESALAMAQERGGQSLAELEKVRARIRDGRAQAP